MAAAPTPSFIHMNGQLVPWADARIHVQAPGFTFATAVFEGIRGYRLERQVFIFRLREHLERLAFGMKVLRLEDPPDAVTLEREVMELIRANDLHDDLYIRLNVYVDGGGMMSARGPVGRAIVAWPRGRSATAETGIHAGVSSWARLADHQSPPRVKATANYMNSRLANLEAQANGYTAAILLTPGGKVAEGASACLFLARRGVLLTPAVTSGILESVTRSAVIELHAELTGRRVEEIKVDRSELYLADEAFLCGTGQEVVPVVSVDRLPVGDGRIGPITAALQRRYFEVARGLVPDHADWRTPAW